jgi:predicted dehydrogenase
MRVSLRLCTSAKYLINLIAPAFQPFSIRRRETVSDRDVNELSLSMMPVARLLNARLASTGNSEELLRELRPELVSICTYVGSRPALVEASVRNGAKAIWCEKPLSLTMQEGRRLVELCEENGVKLVLEVSMMHLAIFQGIVCFV